MLSSDNSIEPPQKFTVKTITEIRHPTAGRLISVSSLCVLIQNRFYFPSCLVDLFLARLWDGCGGQ